ncbi:hypothetical protein Pcac1_g24686 [Phytophthora cactorum]|nr:hypothetical protein Pcac1_g24686 [Phytophthora cactorum]
MNIAVALGRFIVTDDIDPVISRVDKHGLRQAIGRRLERDSAWLCGPFVCECDAWLVRALVNVA